MGSIHDQVRRTVMSHCFRRLRDIDEEELDLCINFYQAATKAKEAKALRASASPQSLTKKVTNPPSPNTKMVEVQDPSLSPDPKNAKIALMASELRRMGDAVYGLSIDALNLDDLCVLGYILKVEIAKEYLLESVRALQDAEQESALVVEAHPSATNLSSIAQEDETSVPIGQMIDNGKEGAIAASSQPPKASSIAKKRRRLLSKSRMTNALESYHIETVPMEKNRRPSSVIEVPVALVKKVPAKQLLSTKSSSEKLTDVEKPSKKSQDATQAPAEKKARKEKVLATSVTTPPPGGEPKTGGLLATLGLVMTKDGTAVRAETAIKTMNPFSFVNFAPLPDEDDDDEPNDELETVNAEGDNADGDDTKLAVVDANIFTHVGSSTAVAPSVQVLDLYQSDAAEFLHKQVRLHGTLSVEKGAELLVNRQIPFIPVDKASNAEAEPQTSLTVARTFVTSVFKAFHKKDSFYFDHGVAYT